MRFIEGVFDRARQNKCKIILPEPEDERTLKAAFIVETEGIAKTILVGDRDAIDKSLNVLGIRHDFEIVDPRSTSTLEEFTSIYWTMRKSKGLTEDQARAAMLQPIPHGIMMVNKGLADGLVAGAIHSTGDTLRPALQIIRTAPDVSLVSSFFFMAFEDRTYAFADCGLVENPDAEQLAEIALCTAQSAISFGIEPTVAMLSYSTKGSAHSPLTEKVVTATAIAKQRSIERFGADSAVRIDGELQGDAALVESVGRRKCPDSEVAGRAKVLIFPDLNAGNIAYKLVERLGGATAYGPIVQGLRLPVNDLSRGCTPEDIVGVIAITAVQSQLRASQSRQAH